MAQLEIPFGIKIPNPLPVDKYYYNTSDQPYTDTDEVISQVVSAVRYIGQTFNVAGEEYWFKDDTTTLEAKASGGGGSELTPDELDAIQSANNPSSSNPFATIDDLPTDGLASISVDYDTFKVLVSGNGVVPLTLYSITTDGTSFPGSYTPVFHYLSSSDPTGLEYIPVWVEGSVGEIAFGHNMGILDLVNDTYNPFARLDDITTLNYIPLSGTTVGNEITGSLNLVDASNIRIHSSSDTSVMTTNIGSGSIKVQLPADPYSMTVDPENITIEFDGESTNISGNAIATTANDITIATGGDGIKEAVDYSANYTALSLVNKGYVDSKVNSGEWTPTLTTDFDSAALNVAYYQKIGNMVLFQISFSISTAVATTGVVSFSAVPDIEIDSSSATNVTGVWSSRQGNILDSTGNIKLLQNSGEIVFAMDTGGVPSIGTYRFEISGSYKTIS